MCETFGDNICKKEKDKLRIGFLNIGGLSVQQDNFKDEELRKGISTWEFDIFGIAETNIDWRLVPEKDRLFARTREWRESIHLSFSYNVTTPPVDRRQWGGNALFSIDKAAHRVVEKGSDPFKLGRWCWTMYRGRDNHILKVYSAYCPNPPSGPLSVFAQQRTALLQRQDERNPRLAFAQDLAQDIKEAMQQQEKVILMLDGNSDMRNSELASILQQCSLKEVILQRHGVKGPATCRRNQARTPIDGIWASPGIQITAGGYLDYDQIIPGADHRTLWVEVSYVNALGHVMPAVVRPQARRLHCRDPRIVQNYVRRYEKLATENNLVFRVESLAQKASYPLTPTLQAEFEELDNVRCQITKEAEKRCRKLRKGQVEFSPALQKASRQIKVFTLLHRKLANRKVSSRLIRRSITKAGLPHEVLGYSKEQVRTKLKESYDRYYLVKKEHVANRLSHLEELATVLAEQQNIEKANMLRQLREREHQRSVARKIRYLQGKLSRSSTTMVTSYDSEGNLFDITDKIKVEQAIMQSNEAKFKQSHHRPFFQLPLKREFGFKGLTSQTNRVLAGVYECRDDLPIAEQLLLQALEMPQEIRNSGPQTMDICLTSYKNFWRKAWEKTSSYPSVISFSTSCLRPIKSRISASYLSTSSVLLVASAITRLVFAISILFEIAPICRRSF